MAIQGWPAWQVNLAYPVFLGQEVDLDFQVCQVLMASQVPQVFLVKLDHQVFLVVQALVQVLSSPGQYWIWICK